MSEITSYHNYIVVTPNGDIAGFREIDDARNFVSGYYIGKVEEMSDDFSVVYSDYVTDPMQTTEAICTSLGAYEGECVIYDLDSLIENTVIIFIARIVQELAKIRNVKNNDRDVFKYLVSITQIEVLINYLDKNKLQELYDFCIKMTNDYNVVSMNNIKR